jgi:hypothetical protein
MAASKKRVIKSLDNLSEDLKELIRRQYPSGYESSIHRISNARNEPIFVFPLETDEATYLVKVPATRNSEGGYEVAKQEAEEVEAGRGEGEDEDSYGSGEEYDSEYEGDDGGEARPRNDPSYEPDFDG